MQQVFDNSQLENDSVVDGRTLKKVLINFYKFINNQLTNIQNDVTTKNADFTNFLKVVVQQLNEIKQKELPPQKQIIEKPIASSQFSKSVSSPQLNDNKLSLQKQQPSQHLKQSIDIDNPTVISPQNSSKKTEQPTAPKRELDDDLLDYENKCNQLNLLTAHKQKQKELIERSKTQLEKLPFIGNKIEDLKKWCGLQHSSVIFDSAIECTKDIKDFNTLINSRVMNKKNLYFIHVDENDNVFGYFMFRKIQEVDVSIVDPDNFIFLLDTKRKVSVPKQWKCGGNVKSGICLRKKNACLYSFGMFGDDGFVQIYKPYDKQCWCDHIQYTYYGIKETELTGNNDEPFLVKRIIIAEMS
ncbi:TLDc domain-containing protein [Entamoeba marina]